MYIYTADKLLRPVVLSLSSSEYFPRSHENKAFKASESWLKANSSEWSRSLNKWNLFFQTEAGICALHLQSLMLQMCCTAAQLEHFVMTWIFRRVPALHCFSTSWWLTNEWFIQWSLLFLTGWTKITLSSLVQSLSVFLPWVKGHMVLITQNHVQCPTSLLLVNNA